ncbi:MAG: hypothetical protein HOM52_06215 [Rhodospirillaceae bacterium]|jgi:hypothetical protein|nr:hypothetical protein [Rhodospirillaceae bacterium]MBT3928802.1 hypothetical protein [Rhodospirillaceae bacterium]MBT5038085.1 hypothetical protein [Rhodospirillaceae bacterium]MBT5677372.1 hypothetical protein [Rhodospirillaceae bacterium]MBT5780099.1 hypothetical protein [Rhodospirillaceae bacterium]
MAVPQSVKEELEKRGELILALEMLTVDQACRLLALEAVVANIPAAKKAKTTDVKAYIAAQSKRYRKHFEGQSLSGFTERAERIAGELIAPAKATTKAAAKKPAKAKKAAVKKTPGKSVKKPKKPKKP